MLTSKTGRKIGTTMLLAAGAIALGAVACDKNASNEPTGTNTNSASTPATPPASSATITGANMQQDPLASAENKARVKELPDETKISPPRQAQVLSGFTVEIRESPGGEAIATTTLGQPAREVARASGGDYYLVVLADPKDSSKQLAGWIYKDALENNAWAKETLTNPGAATGGGGTAKTTQELKCTHGEAHVRTSIDFCAKTCKDDSGCDKSAGEICDGVGREVHESDGKLSNISYCISSSSPKTNQGK